MLNLFKLFEKFKPNFTMDSDFGIDSNSNMKFNPKDFPQMFKVIPTKDQFGESWFRINDKLGNHMKTERTTEDQWMVTLHVEGKTDTSNSNVKTSDIENIMANFCGERFNSISAILKKR